MANKRQKKKKNSQASKQAAAAYKGKNAPVVAKAAPAKKPAPVQQAAKEETKPEAPKPVEQPSVEKKAVEPAKKAAAQKAKAKNKNSKAANKKAKSKKSRKKFNFKFAFSKIQDKILDLIKKIGLRKTSAIILAISVVIALISVIALVVSLRFSVPKEAIVDYHGREVSSFSSYLVEDDLSVQYQFSDNMKRKGDTKRFRYYAATKLVFPEKYSSAVLNLVNVFDNDCVLVASIVDDAGNIYYQSLGLPAGYALSNISVNDLRYGTHDLKLVVAAYDPESYKHIGTQYSDITVQVGIEEEITNVEESKQDKS